MKSKKISDMMLKDLHASIKVAEYNASLRMYYEVDGLLVSKMYKSALNLLSEMSLYLGKYLIWQGNMPYCTLSDINNNSDLPNDKSFEPAPERVKNQIIDLKVLLALISGAIEYHSIPTNVSIRFEEYKNSLERLLRQFERLVDATEIEKQS